MIWNANYFSFKLTISIPACAGRRQKDLGIELISVKQGVKTFIFFIATLQRRSEVVVLSQREFLTVICSHLF